MDVQLVWMPGRPAIDESGVRKVCHTSFHTPILESFFEQYIGEAWWKQITVLCRVSVP